MSFATYPQQTGLGFPFSGQPQHQLGQSFGMRGNSPFGIDPTLVLQQLQQLQQQIQQQWQVLQQLQQLQLQQLQQLQQQQPYGSGMQLNSWGQNTFGQQPGIGGTFSLPGQIGNPMWSQQSGQPQLVPVA